jgi:ABC-type lipoprotein export system ATPase subunit
VIDLQIEEKEFLSVWGPSGSGKTFLIRKKSDYFTMYHKVIIPYNYKCLRKYDDHKSRFFTIYCRISLQNMFLTYVIKDLFNSAEILLACANPYLSRPCKEILKIFREIEICMAWLLLFLEKI